MPRILIIDALAAGAGRRRSSVDAIGAGPRTVAGVLEQRGKDYELTRVEEVLRNPRRFTSFDVILVSAMSMDYPSVLRVSRLFRRSLKVLGGPITTDPRVVSRLGFDLGVYGEGEVALDSLIEMGLFEGALDPEAAAEIPNVVVGGRPPREVRRISRREFWRFRPSVEALRSYRNPSFRASRVFVEVVRGCSNFRRALVLADWSVCSKCGLCLAPLRRAEGCPQGIPPGCGYCSIPAVYGPPKSRRAADLVEEVRGIIGLGVRRIILSGADVLEYGRDFVSSPVLDPEHPGPNVSAIKRLLSSIGSIPEVREGSVYVGIENAKPSLMTEEVVEVLAERLPGTAIHVGVETGHEFHSRLLGRPCGPKRALEAISAAVRAGLRVYAYFIHGLPGQTVETAASTVALIERLYELGVEKVTVYRFRPLPGSAFEGMREGPPARRDRASSMIERAAREFNMARKRQMVDRVLEAVYSGSSYRGLPVLYPLGEGPVMVSAERLRMKPGESIKVKVLRAVSDRMLLVRPT